jgi:hypothetical protein
MISEAFEYSRFNASRPILIVYLANSSSDLLIFARPFLRTMAHDSFYMRLRILSVNLACLKYVLAIVFFM